VQFKVSRSNGNIQYDIVLCADAGVDCIEKNSYKEEKCQSQIDELYRCCNLFYQQQGDDAHTVSCPKASLLRLKMKQRLPRHTTGVSDGHGAEAATVAAERT